MVESHPNWLMSGVMTSPVSAGLQDSKVIKVESDGNSEVYS